MDNDVLKIKDLTVDFMTTRGIVYAVQGVNLNIRHGEIHGIVGESGCGKSVTSKSILRLHDRKHTRYGGQILFQGAGGTRNVLSMSEKELQNFRGNDVSMIFQDPMTSLNPIMRAGEQIAEILRKKKKAEKEEARQEVLEMFGRIGITPAEKRYDQYPFEMSGGMLQRIMIAMALICKPRLLIADEPTTALDVTIQAQILDIIRTMATGSDTAVMLITHNLGVVAEVCSSVSVMYAGSIVESGSVLDIFDRPAHPYTRALLQSNPTAEDEGKRLVSIPGCPPLLYARFTGCPFAPRCRYCSSQCTEARPERTMAGDGHEVSCFRWKEVAS